MEKNKKKTNIDEIPLKRRYRKNRNREFDLIYKIKLFEILFQRLDGKKPRI